MATVIHQTPPDPACPVLIVPVVHVVGITISVPGGPGRWPPPWPTSTLLLLLPPWHHPWFTTGRERPVSPRRIRAVVAAGTNAWTPRGSGKPLGQDEEHHGDQEKRQGERRRSLIHHRRRLRQAHVGHDCDDKDDAEDCCRHPW